MPENLPPPVAPSLRTAPPPMLAGVRRAAWMEIGLFFAVLMLVGYLLNLPPGMYGLQPHPYWVIVLLMSVQYGLREGLLAALVATAVLFMGELPPQGFAETQVAYNMRVLATPGLWWAAALVLGGIRSQHEAARQKLLTELAAVQTAADTIHAAYQRLKARKESLELRLATAGIPAMEPMPGSPDALAAEADAHRHA